MKLAIVGLLLVGQILAAQRLKRDAPPLPQWDVPGFAFERSFGGQEGGFESEARGLVGGQFGEDGRFVGEGYAATAGFGTLRHDGHHHDEYQVPHEDYGVPHEEYGVPHEEYGPPALRVEPVTEHYCPEEDIVPPFAPAPPAPEAFPLPAPVVLREEYGPPEIHEEYGVPHENYGPPAVPTLPPLPPPPTIYYAPYPAVTTTTETPTTPEPLRVAPYPAPTLPPAPVIFTAPYPAPTLPPAPVIYTAPYPPPTLPPTLPPVYTEPPTTSSVPVRIAPYPAKTGYPDKVESKYETDSGHSSAVSGGDYASEHIIVPAVRAPTYSFSYVKPKVVFTKKLITFPKFSVKKKFLLFR